MKITKIHLWDRDLSREIATPEILWPPSTGVPDVLLIDGAHFVRATHRRLPEPSYREAKAMIIKEM